MPLSALVEPAMALGDGGVIQPDLMALPESALKARRLSKKHGHAAVPGTGPKDETCGSCSHLARRQMSRAYLKCGLMRAYWTGGDGTDVRAADPACRRWTA